METLNKNIQLMSFHPNTEEQLVEQAAIGLFAEMGWQTASALVRLNPVLPPQSITAAVDELIEPFDQVAGTSESGFMI